MSNKVAKPLISKKALLPIFDRLNDQYFGGLVVAGIGWRNLPIDQGNIVSGECVFDERLIRINHLLKDREVPDYFLDYVVYHEMVHLVYHPGAAELDGHEDPHHNPRFQSIEKRHPFFKQSAEFEASGLLKIADKWREYREFLRKNG